MAYPGPSTHEGDVEWENVSPGVWVGSRKTPVVSPDSQPPVQSPEQTQPIDQPHSARRKWRPFWKRR